MISVQFIIESAVIAASEYYKEILLKEIKAQGHSNRGTLVNSIEYDVQFFGDQMKSVFSGENYIGILDAGVRPDRIPFRFNSGAQTSKYIDGLIEYFRSKGNSERESKRYAFATARKQKEEGMPTKGSFRFSSNGHRTKFIERAWDESYPKIVRMLLDDTIELIQSEVIKYATAA